MDKYTIECVAQDKMSATLRNVAQSCNALNTATKGAAQGAASLDSSLGKTSSSTASTASWLKFGVAVSMATKALGFAKQAADAMGRNVATEGLYKMELRFKALSASLADLQTNMGVAGQLRDLKFGATQTNIGASGGGRVLTEDIDESNSALAQYQTHLEDISKELDGVDSKWQESYSKIEGLAKDVVDKLPDNVKGKLGNLTTALAGLGVPVKNLLDSLGGKESLETLDQERQKLTGMKESLEGMLRAETARNTVLKEQNSNIQLQNLKFAEQLENANKLAEVQRGAEDAARAFAGMANRSAGRVTGWTVPGQKGSQAEGREARREQLAQDILSMDEDKRDAWQRKLREKRGKLSDRDAEALAIMKTLGEDSLTADIRKNATPTERAEFMRNVQRAQQKEGEDALRKLAEFLMQQFTQK